MSNTQHGTLLIADITGYTMYLSQSELDHAQEVLTALLELLLKQTRPPMVVSRTAGDAVISYGLGDNFIQGQTFVEMVENTYVAFRRAIQQMVLNNNCQCNACRNIGGLDLKFFVHAGSFALQRLGDHTELVGSDVNLIHRLLKNHVSEQHGLKAYTLFTDAALRQLGIEELRETLIAHTETYEHLGEVQVWLQDMQAAWNQNLSTLRVGIPPERLLVQMETDTALPQELVWDYLSQPEFRRTIMGSDRQEVVRRKQGRIDQGSAYHCYHGDRLVLEEILEWQPFERIVTQDDTPLPQTTILIEWRLEPTKGGTHLAVLFSKAKGPFIFRRLSDMGFPQIMKRMEKNLTEFKYRIEADQEKREAEKRSAASVAENLDTL